MERLRTRIMARLLLLDLSFNYLNVITLKTMCYFNNNLFCMMSIVYFIRFVPGLNLEFNHVV